MDITVINGSESNIPLNSRQILKKTNNKYNKTDSGMEIIKTETNMNTSEPLKNTNTGFETVFIKAEPTDDYEVEDDVHSNLFQEHESSSDADPLLLIEKAKSKKVEEKSTYDKTFECEDCGKHFSQKHVLVRHQRIHSGYRPLTCTFCDKKFRDKADLTKHTRVHTGVKPYACSQCNMKFTQSSNLSSHMKVHSGAKPFECQYCGNKFAEKGSLKRHLRIHTGERPFGCTICHRRFAQKGELGKHVKIHIHNGLLNW